jgi:ketosteroid isomerase-like protein
VTDRASADAWVQRYLRAWESNDPDAIGSLFTDDAVYRPTPMSEGWRGRQAIVDGWLDRKDDPGTWKFEYEVLAADGDLVVVRGVTRYDPPYPAYDNLWLIRLDDRGRASEFIEYWMEHPKPEGTGSAG